MSAQTEPRLEAAELQLLLDSVSSALEKTMAHQELAGGNSGKIYEPAIWHSLCELGLLQILPPHHAGGFGASLTDCAHILMVCGAKLAPAPLTEIGLPLAILSRYPRSTLPEHVLPAVGSGEIRCGFAALQCEQNPCIGTHRPDAIELSGRSLLVPGASACTHMLVSASIDDGDSRQPLLALVDLSSPGVSLNCYKSLDGGQSADLHFDKVQCAIAPPVNPGPETLEAEQFLRGSLSVLAAAEMTGCMQALVDKTVSYTKTRKQFGNTLSQYQVLQHRMVDMQMATELCRAMTLRTAHACDASPEKPSAAVHALR